MCFRLVKDVEDEEAFLQEVKQMTVLINYYWGAWSIVSMDLNKLADDQLFR